MRIIAVDNIDDMGKAAAELIISKIRQKPDCILGLATGSTPISLYENLIKAYVENQIKFKEVKTFNLDEYVGLGADDPNSYRHFMNEKLFSKVDINIENTHVPDGLIDSKKSIKKYRELLSDNKIEIQILGIGSNGHIGFNEPGVPFDSTVHLVDLDKQTILDNARFFDSMDNVPKQAITMGIADIMDAEEIILMAGTENKKEALKRVLEGPADTDCPATVLRGHKGLTIIALKNVLHDINLNLI